MPKTAILIDGAYFLKRMGDLYPDNIGISADPHKAADLACELALLHAGVDAESEGLLGIFFYDGIPLTESTPHPITKRRVNLEGKHESKFRSKLHEALARKRKVTLWLGSMSGRWGLPEKIEEKLNSGGKIVLDSGDIRFIPSQKEVDVRLALDMGRLSQESDLDCIVLVAGDCDFVPAVELARSRGVRVILDPMWGSASQKLKRSVDAVKNLFPKPEGYDQTWPSKYVDPEILRRDCFLGARPAEEAMVDLKEGEEVKAVAYSVGKNAARVLIVGDAVKGYLHIDDYEWERVSSVADHVAAGDELDLKVLSIDRERCEVSLGRKQMRPDPWKNIRERHKLRDRVDGVVSAVTDRGIFVDLPDGIRGLVRPDEMDPSEELARGDEVEVMIIKIDEDRREMPLSIKKCKRNPRNGSARPSGKAKHSRKGGGSAQYSSRKRAARLRREDRQGQC